METEILNELLVQTQHLAGIESALTMLFILVFGFLAVYFLLKWRNRHD